MDKSSAFRILGLDPSATRAEAKKAFRQMAKTCHPDRYAGQPGAADAEERMKILNQAFALLMKVLPKTEGSTEVQDAGVTKKVQPKRHSLFSELRKRVSGLKKAGMKRRNRAGLRPEDSGAGRPAGTVRQRPARPVGCQRRSPAGMPSFDSILNGTASAPGSSRAMRPGAQAWDAYSRYVRLKQQMQAQRRRPRQSSVSRVEKISPVQPVHRVGKD